MWEPEKERIKKTEIKWWTEKRRKKKGFSIKGKNPIGKYIQERERSLGWDKKGEGGAVLGTLRKEGTGLGG